MLNEKTKGYFLRVGAALIFGLFGVFAKMLPADPFALSLAFQATGLVTFFIIALRTGKIGITKKGFIWIAVTTAIVTAADLLFFMAAKTIPVANAEFIKFTFPIFVLVLAPLILKEKFRKETMYAILLGLAGLGLILGADLSKFELTGFVYALGCAIGIGLFLTFLKKVFEHTDVKTWLFWRYLLASCFLAPIVIARGSLASTTGMQIVALIGFGLLFAVIASFIDMEGLKRIPAQDASVLGYVEPLSATMYGFLLLSQPITITTILGGLLIIAAGMVVIRSGSKQELAKKQS